MKYLASAIPYMGNKYKLLKYIIPLFPHKCEVFIDLFGGSGTVCINYKGTKNTIYNEFNKNIVELVKMIKEVSPESLNDYFISKVNEYGLDNCSIKAEDRINRTGYNSRKENYNRLRDDYNKSELKDYKDLFLLIRYSINHLIRFNSNNEFNASSGADSYNDKVYKNIIEMHKALQGVEILSKNALEFNPEEIPQDAFIYCDPPYLNTEAIYNEKGTFGGWNIDRDYKLFEFLEKLDSKGIKWGLSNVFVCRGKVNQHLIDWCNEKGWFVHHLDRNYNPFSRGNSNNDEVYISNYSKYIKMTLEDCYENSK